MTIRMHPVSIAVLAGVLLAAGSGCGRVRARSVDLLATCPPQTASTPDGRVRSQGQVEAGLQRLPPVEPTWLDLACEPAGLLGLGTGEREPFAFLKDPDPEVRPCGWWSDEAAVSRAESRASRRARRRSNFRSALLDTCGLVRSDHDNFYNWVTMRDLLIGISAAGVLANTSIDENFDAWHEDDVRTRETDHFAAFWKTWGEGEIFIPAFAAFGLIGAIAEDRPILDGLGLFGGNVTRAYAIGAPPMLLMQFTLGASRPGEATIGSAWQPFQDDNGASGHAFIGAVPFITAAGMTDNACLKAFFYTCSMFTGWSRINDRQHYLSQVGLGWWMAYLSCRAIRQTDSEEERVTFSPLVTPEMVGGCVMLRR